MELLERSKASESSTFFKDKIEELTAENDERKEDEIKKGRTFQPDEIIILKLKSLMNGTAAKGWITPYFGINFTVKM